MTKQEKIRFSKKLTKASYVMGFFYSIIFFTSRFFSNDYSLIASLFGSIAGGFVGSYIYYLITKKITFSLLEEIERGFQATIIPSQDLRVLLKLASISARKAVKFLSQMTT